MAGKTVFQTENNTKVKELTGMPDYPLHQGMKIEFQDLGDVFEVIDWKMVIADEPTLVITVQSVGPNTWFGGL